MKTLLNGLKRHDIGQRAMTEDDFWRICEAENITVLWTKEKFPFCFEMLGKAFIVMPKRLKGLKFLFSGFHELAHLLSHCGREPAAFWSGLADSKAEFEADAAALVAIIPKHLIREMAYLDGSRYSDRLWQDRVRLYFLYDI